MRRLVVLALSAALAAAGCGKSDSGLSDKAAGELEPRVAALRQLAGARDLPQATSTLAELRAAVQSLLAQKELSESRAAAILDAATAVEQNLAAIAPPTTTAPPPTVPTIRGGDDNDDEDGRGKRKGRGSDSDDD